MLSVNINQFAYNTNDIVLKDINFNINPGEFIGLIGENGAGKSTTIKIILGLNEQQKDAVNIEKEKKLSYIPERPIIYEEMTLWEHIELCAASYHLKNWELEAERLVTLFNLKESVYKYPKKFSKGMQQKLMFILAYLPRPDFYIVDEPIMGLDPLSIKIILEMLQAEKERGAGILMSTHALDTAEKYFDRFIILADRTIIYQGTFQNLKTLTHNEHGDLLDCFTTLVQNDGDIKHG